MFFRRAIGQTVINFVGHDQRSQFGQRAHAFRLQHDAGGVAGRIDEHGPRPRGDQPGHILRTVLEPLLLMRERPHGHAPGVTHEVGVAGIAGIGQDDLVSRIEQRGKQHHHGGGGTGEDQNLIRPHAHAVPPPVKGAYGLAQLHVAEGMRVVGPSLVESGHSRVADAGGRVEIRLSKFQMNDGRPLAFELLGAFQNLHCQKRRNAADSLGCHVLSFMVLPDASVSFRETAPPRRGRAARHENGHENGAKAAAHGAGSFPGGSPARSARKGAGSQGNDGQYPFFPRLQTVRTGLRRAEGAAPGCPRNMPRVRGSAADTLRMQARRDRMRTGAGPDPDRIQAGKVRRISCQTAPPCTDSEMPSSRKPNPA